MREQHGHRTGDKRSPTYSSWQAMIRRCIDPNSPGYQRYGGAGITVCERWRHSFMNFLSDMGERPEGKTLDRFPDPKGNYQPGNCRWATWEEQVSTRSPMSYYPKNRKSRKAP